LTCGGWLSSPDPGRAGDAAASESGMQFDDPADHVIVRKVEHQFAQANGERCAAQIAVQLRVDLRCNSIR